MVVKTLPFFMPNPADFRAWVRNSLTILGVSAQSISRDLGMGRNALGQFLATPDRSIHLSSAHFITCKLLEIAAASGAVLPEIEGAANV